MADGPGFVLYVDRAGEYRWTLRAANNEPIADSAEGYLTRASCVEAIRSRPSTRAPSPPPRPDGFVIAQRASQQSAQTKASRCLR